MSAPLLYCLTLLKRRIYSRYELEQAMQRRGFEEEERSQAVQELEELRLIDDLAFARAWVNTRNKLAPRGKAVLRLELIKKGIAKGIIEQVFTEQAADEERPDEFDLAKQLLRGKERLYARLPDDVRKRRIIGLLQRRGFSYDVIRRILDT